MKQLWKRYILTQILFHVEFFYLDRCPTYLDTSTVHKTASLADKEQFLHIASIGGVTHMHLQNIETYGQLALRGHLNTDAQAR